MRQTLLAAPGEILRGHEFSLLGFYPEIPAVLACRRSPRRYDSSAVVGRLAGGQHVRQLSAPALCAASHHAQPLAGCGRERAMTLLAWGVAWLLDFIIGDPQTWPHPVRWTR